MRNAVCLMQCFALSKETRECGIRVPEVQEMNPEQERQAQAKRIEDRIQELDKDLRYLNWQIAKLEKMVRSALEQVNMVDLSTPWQLLHTGMLDLYILKYYTNPINRNKGERVVGNMHGSHARS